MRYLVIRKKENPPKILVWEDESLTHPAIIKEQKISHADISSVGYVVFNQATDDFMITWHTPYADEPDDKVDAEDKQLLLSHMRQVYGSDETTKRRMADEFDRQQRQNKEIRKQFFKGGGR